MSTVSSSSSSNYPHHVPLRVKNSHEIQAQVQQTLQSMQSMSIFPPEGSAEPPPPYPMGTAQLTNNNPSSSSNYPNVSISNNNMVINNNNNPAPPPPPSYSASLAMRQSPTLSSTSSDYRTMSSSDYRRSPGPAAHAAAAAANNLLSANYPHHQFGPVVTSLSNTPTPASPAPSPASSMLSTSSSMQAWSARQTKTHSPIIMQSVKSTQVQKPVLQTATPLAGGGQSSNPGSESNYPQHLPQLHQPQQAQRLTAAVGKGVVTGIAAATSVAAGLETASTTSTNTTGSGASSSSKSMGVPPPSYEFSIQQKHVQSTTPTNIPVNKPQLPLPPPSPNGSTKSRSPTEQSASNQLPPPPPYPSTAVQPKDQQQQMVNGTSVSAKSMAPPVISTAKVANLSQHKPPLQRKYSPAELTADLLRSESPLSDSHTVSGASPLSFMSNASSSTTATASGGNELTTDSGLGSAAASSSMPPPPSYKTTHHTSPKPERKKLSPEKEGNRSLIRSCPPMAYKFFMEQRIENVVKEYEQRRNRRLRLERELVQFELEPALIQNMRKVLQHKETNYLRMKRAKLNKRHFKKIKKIGVGAFGEVSLVRYVNSVNKSKSGGLYAMKTLKKSHVVEKNQVAHVIAEKDILAEADNEWIVKLYYSFQVS